MSLSRRRFIGALSATSVAGVERLLGLPSSPKADGQAEPHFAYVASRDGRRPGLHVYLTGPRSWQLTQFIPSTAPSSLAISPDNQTLFVANRVRRVAGLPAGSVESYNIDSFTGRLTLRSRRALALSAVEPEHLAVSPDGRSLAVACTGGGSYNILPIAEDGSLMSVRLLSKQAGCGPHPLQDRAYPKQVLFDARGRLLSLDFGLDRISCYKPLLDTLEVLNRYTLPAGTGPTVMSFDRGGSLLFIAGGLTSSLLGLQIGVPEETTGSQPLLSGHDEGNLCSALCAHPRADIMLGAWHDSSNSTLATWSAHHSSRPLAFACKQKIPGLVTQIVPAPGVSETFYALSSGTDQIYRFDADAASGTLAIHAPVAHVPSPRALVVRPRHLA